MAQVELDYAQRDTLDDIVRDRIEEIKDGERTYGSKTDNDDVVTLLESILEELKKHA